MALSEQLPYDGVTVSVTVPGLAPAAGPGAPTTVSGVMSVPTPATWPGVLPRTGLDVLALLLTAALLLVLGALLVARTGRRPA